MNENFESGLRFEETLGGRPYEAELVLNDDGRAEVRIVGCDADGQVVAELVGTVPLGDMRAVGRFMGRLPAAVRRAGSKKLHSRPAYNVEAIRRTHPNAYKPWPAEDDERLRSRHGEGATVAELAEEFGRNLGGIRARLKDLGIEVREPLTGRESIYREFGRLDDGSDAA